MSFKKKSLKEISLSFTIYQTHSAFQSLISKDSDMYSAVFINTGGFTILKMYTPSYPQ